MSRVLAVANQKGGVGKTTTAVNLAASLAVAERKTLLIDFDPQCNASASFGFGRNGHGPNSYTLLFDDPVEGHFRQTALKFLKIVRSSRELVGAEIELVPEANRASFLRAAIAPFRDSFQYILIDCPPSLGLLTVNGLVAADAVIIPIQCEYFALEGVSELMENLRRIRAAYHANLAISGIVLTMYDERTVLSRQVREEVESVFGRQVFQTIVPRNVRLGEAPSHGKPIVLYDLGSRGCQAYLRLAREVIEREPA